MAASNLEHWSWNGRVAGFSFGYGDVSETESLGTPLMLAWGAQTRAMGHGLRQGFLLRNLEGVWILFYSLVAAKLIEEELAAGKLFGCSKTVVRAISGGDLAREMAPMVAVWAGYPPLGIESMQGASAR
jgi:hypothetical protein